MALRVFLAWIVGCMASLGAMAQTQAAGVVFRDCADCPEMVVLPAGSFVMGSPDQETGRDEDEGPQRTVTFARPFAVGRFEVTRGQFAAFLAESGFQPRSGNCWYWNAELSKQANDDLAKSWRNPGYPQDDSHPVVCVSWTDAKAYADWLSKKSGKPFRLLTEAEWEYAARAGTSSPWIWGTEANASCGQANIADLAFEGGVPPGKDKVWNSFADCADGSAYTAKAGSRQPNAFGLHDMIGNAWEWTEDCWNASHAGAPADGRARLTGVCTYRVARGGSWFNNPRNARSAIRNRDATANRTGNLGFRLARTL